MQKKTEFTSGFILGFLCIFIHLSTQPCIIPLDSVNGFCGMCHELCGGTLKSYKGNDNKSPCQVTQSMLYILLLEFFMN